MAGKCEKCGRYLHYCQNCGIVFCERCDNEKMIFSDCPSCGKLTSVACDTAVKIRPRHQRE